MEILLPLSTGYLFLFLRGGYLESFAFFAALLIVSFFFHPREYFQVMWYGVIAAIVYLTFNRPEWRILKTRFLPLAIIFVVIAAALLIAARLLSPDQRIISAELAISHAAADWLRGGALAAEPLLNFAMHGIGGQPPAPPLVYSWLVLAAMLLPCLVLVGSRAELQLCAYFLVLWWLTLCLVPTQVLLRMLTYSEVSMTKVRFLPIFAYPVLAAGWSAALTLMRIFLHKWLPTTSEAWHSLSLGVLCAGLGMVFALIWWRDQPDFAIIELALPAVIGACGIIAWLVLRMPELAERLRLTQLRRLARPFMPSPFSPASAWHSSCSRSRRAKRSHSDECY
jgi:hypothetical protein